MFDNITPEERQNSRRTDPAYLKAKKAKFFHQQAQSESEDSNGSHANETKLVGGLYAKSDPNSFFNSFWFVVVTILVFFGCILLTNLVLGL